MNPKKINTKIKGLWGISEVGFALMTTMEVSFFIYFLTDIAKLPLGLSGAIASITAIADAVSSIIAGIVIDKVKFKVGKFRPWLLYCPPFVTLFFVFSFTKIGGDILAGCIMAVGFIMSHFIWNISWTSNRSMIPVLTDDPNERTFLSARLAVGASVGKIFASLLIPYLSAAFMLMFSPVNSYTFLAFITSGMALITYYIHYGITKGYDTESNVGKKAVTFKDMARSVATNGNLVALLFHDSMRNIATIGVSSSVVHYAKVVLEDPTVVSWLLVMFSIGMTVGSLLSTSIAKKIGAKKATILGCLGFAVAIGICYFLPANTFLIAAFLFVAELFYGISLGLAVSLYSMCGTYSLWKTGSDTRGVVMSFSALAIKIGVAMRGILIIAVLGWISYDPNMTVITDTAKNGVKLLTFGVFSVIMLLSIVPLFLFRLNEKKIEEMEKEIAAR